MHKYECDTLRATVYKNYGFNPDTFPHDHLNVVLIQRSPPKGNRLIGNYDEIIDMLDYARTHILVYAHCLVCLSLVRTYPFSSSF